MAWRWVLCGLLAATMASCDACSTSTSPTNTRNGAADGGVRGGLTREQAGQVLARVGQRSITLGDYAAALERMDPFERMRYQTDDRRQALLDEMINVELLAREAERRGLDRRPETLELVRQFQRDELLARLRASLPGPHELPDADVSRYYQDHRAEFSEPELRRAAHIALDDAATARRLVRESAGASPDQWRELVQKYAPTRATDTSDKTTARPPIEVPGDLGFLSADADEPADEVPVALRKAVFQIAKAGDVYPEPVVAAGRQHVVRLVSVREARQSSLAEVDSLIRARLVEAREAEARQALVARLRQAIRIEIDEAALGRIEPAPSASTPPAP
jgi:peptidyl-prolyl cis-trans isomerase C